MECLGTALLARVAAQTSSVSGILFFWSWRRESNPRPSDYKSDALPTELRQQLGTGASPRKLIPRIPSRCPGQLYKVPQGQVRVQQRPDGPPPPNAIISALASFHANTTHSPSRS